MKRNKLLFEFLLIMVAAVIFTGCPKRPGKEIDAAKEAINAAKAAEAPTYAPDEFQSAEEMLAKAIAQSEEKKFKDSKQSAISAKERADLARELALKRKTQKQKETPPAQEEVRFKEPSLTEIPEEEKTGEKGALGEGIKVKSLKVIHFNFDSYILTQDAKDILKENAEWLEEMQKIHVLIEGHCDERGTEEYNLALGSRRAENIKSYLVQMGIAPERLSTISYGEEFPVDAQQSEEAWAKNRRAEFVIIEK
ncbi:MAG TPA: peptidoglycan-associated lipoprotein Pal [bacterium]